jgi:hypothetical protein
MTDAAAHARIITEQATTNGLTAYENDDKVRYQLYKLTIQVIFDILKGSQKRGIGLDQIDFDDLQRYKEGLEEIASEFYGIRGIISSRRSNPDSIQELIDQASTKMTRAASLKEKGKEEECLDKLKECRLKLFHLVEYLETVTIEDNKPPSSPP